MNVNNSMNGHIVIVFALEHYNPLGLIRSLGENNIYPVYIAVKRREPIASTSKYISKCHFVDTVEEGYQLLLDQYGEYDFDHRPVVLFSDDKSIGYFDLHYDEIKNKFICYNAKESGKINLYMNKNYILQVAKKHGFNVLDSYVVKKGEIPEGLVYPIITKDITPNSGSWKSDVFICQNEEELKKAYESITSSVVLLQRFIDKKNEFALEGFSVDSGKQLLIATAMTWKYLITGYYSPYHDVTMFKDKEMEKKLISMFAELGYEGIFEVEFLIDKDGTYYFLEVNFRASAWNYTGTVAGMPLSYLWVKSMLNGFIDENDKKEFEDFTSMSEVIDFGKRVDTGKISIAQWLKEFREAKCTFYYNKDDMAPFEVLYDKWDLFK